MTGKRKPSNTPHPKRGVMLSFPRKCGGESSWPCVPKPNDDVGDTWLVHGRGTASAPSGPVLFELVEMGDAEWTCKILDGNGLLDVGPTAVDALRDAVVRKFGQAALL